MFYAHNAFSEDVLLEEEISVESSSEELAGGLSQPEIDVMEEFDRGLALGLGSSRSWQIWQMSLYMMNKDNSLWVWSFGTGTYTFSGVRDERFYRYSVHSKSLDGAFQYYFTDVAPVYVQLGGGFSYWKGDARTSGDLGEETPDNLNTLSSGFVAMGLDTFTGLGLSFASKKGLYFEYTLVGIGASYKLSSTFSQSMDKAELLIEDILESPRIWGFTNIKFGWFFN